MHLLVKFLKIFSLDPIISIPFEIVQVVAQAAVVESRRERLHRLAVSIAKRYKTEGHTASQVTTQKISIETYN
jgi:hypothetical protein